VKPATEDPGGAGSGWLGAVALAVSGVGTAAFGWLGARIGERRDLLQKSIDRITALEAKLEAQEAEVRDLDRKLTESEATRKVLQENLEDLTAQLAELQESNAELLAGRDELQAEVATALEHVAALSQQVTHLGAQPAPRPERPRSSDGRFAKQKGRKK